MVCLIWTLFMSPASIGLAQGKFDLTILWASFQALVDGPCTNVRRQAMPFKCMQLTDYVIKVPHRWVRGHAMRQLEMDALSNFDTGSYQIEWSTYVYSLEGNVYGGGEMVKLKRLDGDYALQNKMGIESSGYWIQLLRALVLKSKSTFTFQSTCVILTGSSRTRHSIRGV